MLRLLKALPLTLAIAAVSIVATSCSSNNGTKARFVNAIQNTATYGGSLDVEVNGTQQFTNVQFANPSASTYTSIPSGNVTFEGFESPGVTTPVFTDSTTLNDGTEYTEVATGFAGGTGNNVVLLSLSDNNSLPALGTLNFRVINASPNSPGGGGVDIWIEPAPYPFAVQEPATIQNLAYQSVSRYANVPYNPAPGEGFTVFVYTAGGGTQLFNRTFANINAASNTAAVCTLVLTDNANGSTMSSLPVVLDDNNCSN